MVETETVFVQGLDYVNGHALIRVFCHLCGSWDSSVVVVGLTCVVLPTFVRTRGVVGREYDFVGGRTYECVNRLPLGMGRSVR